MIGFKLQEDERNERLRLFNKGSDFEAKSRAVEVAYEEDVGW